MLNQLQNKVQLKNDVIDYSMGLLSAEFPSWNGFESTTFLSKFSQHKTNFVQIIHDGINHWLTVSSNEEGEILIFDSLKKQTLSDKVYQQIARLANCKDKSLRLVNASVQQQTNTINCGLFALAFVVDILNKKCPRTSMYDEGMMRSHLLSCLQNKKIVPFPQLSEKRRGVKRCKETITMEEIFCICRMPFSQNDIENDPGMFMAMCCSCEEWYHKKCLKIPSKIFKSNIEANGWKCMYYL